MRCSCATSPFTASAASSCRSSGSKSSTYWLPHSLGACRRNLMLAPLRLSVVLLLICGGLYPVLVTLVGGVAFPYHAQGSIITGTDGNPVGSELIAQAFDKDQYFHPRPSAAGADGWDATSSGGSNLGSTNQKLIDRVTTDAAALKAENPSLTVLPADLLTTSASWLHPAISPAPPMPHPPPI